MIKVSQTHIIKIGGGYPLSNSTMDGYDPYKWFHFFKIVQREFKSYALEYPTKPCFTRLSRDLKRMPNCIFPLTVRLLLFDRPALFPS